MTDTLSKRVSLIELFYDLVFVYMVSQATALIIVMFGKPLSELRITLPEKRSPGRQFLSFSLW